MNWIETCLKEARERKLPNLELIADWRFRRPSLPPETFQLKHLKSLKVEHFDLGNLRTLGQLTELGELEISWCEGVDLTHLERLEKLKTLTLVGIDLSVVPPGIASLKFLQELDLTANKLQDLPGFISSLEKLTRLNVYLNDFDTVPPVIRKLRALKSLTFRPREKLRLAGASVISALKELELTELNLGSVDFSTSAVQEFGQMSKLEKLALWDAQLTEFPVRLARLPKLQSLHIGGNVEVPDEIAEFRHLHELSLFGSSEGKIAAPSRISKRLAELQQLDSLEFDYKDLDDVYDQLFNLNGLRQLSISNCGVRELLPAVESLVRLEDINLIGNRLNGLPEGLFRLTNLQTLWLPDTHIGSLSEQLENLSRLKKLQVSDCDLSSLPVALSALKDLTLLRAARNKLTALPEGIGGLNKLEILGLERNQLREIPKHLAFLPKLRELNLENNPLSEPPPEIVSQGLIGIQNYFSALVKEPVERLYEAKILIVGEGAVGKTCLAKKLIDPTCALEQSHEKLRSTEGIDIRKWQLATPHTHSFRINLWDFGGQEIYHATHQFFLTKRSLYLFVWDARKEDRIGGFDYWLNIVRLLSAGSPVIVILNKADERIREIDESDLKKHFPNIQEFHKVSALTGAGLDVLRDRVAAIAAGLPHVGDQWPATWSSVRRILEEQSRDHISREEYEQICEAQGIPASQMSSLSSYLHDLGVILHFQDDALLQGIVILKPNWGTNAVYKVLDTRLVQDAKGRFTMADLRKIWGTPKYPPSCHLELLQLMIKFELCFPLGTGAIYVAPELLSAEMPELSWDSSGNLVFEYHYSFMPAGIMTRFIARMHQAIEGENYWRNGVVLEWRGSRALVVSEPLSRKIGIAVMGANRRELLVVIRHQIDEIHKTLNDPRVTEMVPCICTECKNGSPHLFSYRTLEAYIAKSIEYIRCEKSLEEVPIRMLLAEIFEPRSAKESLAEGRVPVTIAHVENMIIGSEATMKISKSSATQKNNPWVSGSFYLVSAVVLLSVLMAAGRVLSPWWLPVIILGGLLLVTVIGAFQLRNDDRLKERGFLELMRLAFRQIPLLGKFGGRGGRRPS